MFPIKNQVNGRVFVAASSNLAGAMARDRTWLGLGSHLNKALQEEWKTFGPEAFTFDVLNVLKPTDEPRNDAEALAVLLEVWFDSLQPYGEKGYLTPKRR